jgi:hypothetical protein
MTQNKIHPGVLTALLPEDPVHATAATSASLAARLRAKVFAARFDQQVESGAAVRAGSALAVHTAQLTSTRERERLAGSLHHVVRAAHYRSPGIPLRTPLHRAGIVSVEDLIAEVILRLHAPVPVRARGIARLRMLLSDGTGPLYRPGRGSLGAALRGVLAAL